MEFTPNYNLPCLDDSDYAAYALYMQCLAESLDNKFQEQFESMDTFLRRPSLVLTRTTPQTGIVNSLVLTDQQFLNVFEVEAAYNWPYSTLANIPAIRGWWFVGLTVNLQASGVVNADTIRQLLLRGDATVNDDGLVTPDYVRLADQVWESNSGNGENLTVSGTVFQPGFDSIPLQGYCVHQNTSSTLTMTTTPQPRLWVTYIGDTPEIGQV